MTKFVRRARVFAAVALLPLTLPVAHAAPSALPTPKSTHKVPSKSGPKLPAGAAPKTKSVPKALKPIPNRTRSLDRRLLNDLKQPKPLNDAAVAEVAGRFAIDTDGNDVLGATTLTVRRPYAGAGAYMTFPDAEAVRVDAHPDGIASVDSGGSLRRVRGTGPAITDSGTLDDIHRQHDPLHPDFPTDADVTITGSYFSVHLVAAANRDYVVSCRVSPATSSGWSVEAKHWGAHIEIGGRYDHVVSGLEPDNGRVSFAIPRAASKRGIDLQIFAHRPVTSLDGFGWGQLAGGSKLARFSVSRCDIVPIG